MSARSLLQTTSSLRLASGVRQPLVRTFQASFSTTHPLYLKESARDTDVDHDAHKKDSLQKQKAGKAEWKRELASDSEEAVHADKANFGGATNAETIENLQKHTKDAAEKK